MKTVIVATGQKNVDEAIAKFDHYEIVSAVEYRNEIQEACKFFNADILVIGEGLAGHESLMQILLQLVRDYPNMRIIYLAGYVDLKDEAKVNALGVLVMAGIYDIIHEKKITIQSLRNILDNPKDQESMEYLTKRVKEASSRDSVQFEIPEEELAREEEDVYKNLFVVSSIKPGTGKSFLSTNVATAIAQFGVDNKDGKRPRVALIEADLQNLSVGTLLQIEDDKKNLKAVMEQISKIVNEDGKFVGTLQQTEETNNFIKSCFKPYYRVKNLEALVGSQLTFNEIETIQPYYYVYLIDAIINEFDVIVVDTNSSLTHITTFPLLQMAKSCYYVLNLDFNNVRNNARYKDILQEMGIINKVKYVLNEDIINDRDQSATGADIENLIFTADHLDDSAFKLEARVPMLPKTVFLNRLYEGTPVVLDDKKYTTSARYEIMKVANQIWPIKNFKEIEEKYLAQFGGGKKKGRFSLR